MEHKWVLEDLVRYPLTDIPEHLPIGFVSGCRRSMHEPLVGVGGDDGQRLSKDPGGVFPILDCPDAAPNHAP